MWAKNNIHIHFHCLHRNWFIDHSVLILSGIFFWVTPRLGGNYFTSDITVYFPVFLFFYLYLFLVIPFCILPLTEILLIHFPEYSMKTTSPVPVTGTRKKCPPIRKKHRPAVTLTADLQYLRGHTPLATNI